MPSFVRHPGGLRDHPALVLNADFRPLSYLPLSLWPWQEAVKAAFLERVVVVAEYDAVVHSPSIAVPNTLGGRAEGLREASTHHRLHPLQPLPARRVHLPVLRRPRPPDLRPRRAALARRPHHLGERRRLLRSLQPRQGLEDAEAGRDAPAPQAGPPEPEQLQNVGRKFPPNHLHDSWMDYLYWDAELEA